MRVFTVTKEQFDTFLFRHVALSGSDGNGDAEAGLRLIRKFKDRRVTELVPLTDDQKQLEASGEKVFPFRRLTVPQAEFVLETDEWKFLKALLMQRRAKVPLLALEEFEEVRIVVEQAKEVPEAGVETAQG